MSVQVFHHQFSKKLLSVLTLGVSVGSFLSISFISQAMAYETYTGQDDAPSLVITGSVQRTLKQQPGIVGLDMVIRRNAYPLVEMVFRDSPAHRQGMLPGDKILAVDGSSTFGRSDSEVDYMISDVPGTPVEFTIERAGRMLKLTITVQSLSHVSKSLKKPFAAMADPTITAADEYDQDSN